MKHLFILLLTLISSTCFAQQTTTTTDIPLQGGGKEEWPIDNRSLVITPKASHDGNILYLSADACISDMQIVVKDAAGNVVFSTVTTLLGQATFVLSDVSSGDYFIELQYGDQYLYGWFSIE